MSDWLDGDWPTKQKHIGPVEDPWWWSDDDGREAWSLRRSRDGGPVLIPSFVVNGMKKANEFLAVKEALGVKLTMVVMSRADACLIAKAPDLLRCIRDLLDDPMDQSAIGIARSLIQVIEDADK